MGATLGPPQPRTLPAPLPRQDSQAPQAVLRGAQVALGVLKPRRKELGSSLGLTRRRQMATFSKQHSMFQTPGCAGQAGASAVRSQPDPPESLAPLSPGRVWSRKGPKPSLRAGQPPEAVGGAAKGRGGDSSGVCLKSTVWCVFRAIWR